MANILALRRRIHTAQNVSKTTRAMQMIATSKLKKAQDAALASRAYVNKLTNVTRNLTEKIEDEKKNDYMKTNSNSDMTLLIVLSPDKGLCGGLISNLTKELLNQDSSGKIEYLNIGKKLENSVARLNREILASFEFGTTLPLFDAVYPIAKVINDEFLSKKVSDVKILYSNFLTVFTQVPKVQTLLPIKIDQDNDVSSDKFFTLFEPDIESMLPVILKHYLEMSIYQFLLESYASEQAARMIAMKNATENALDMIDDLKLEYNKQRQEKITNEILDIGSGASQMMYE